MRKPSYITLRRKMGTAYLKKTGDLIGLQKMDTSDLKISRSKPRTPHIWKMDTSYRNRQDENPGHLIWENLNKHQDENPGHFICHRTSTWKPRTPHILKVIKLPPLNSKTSTSRWKPRTPHMKKLSKHQCENPGHLISKNTSRWAPRTTIRY